MKKSVSFILFLVMILLSLSSCTIADQGLKSWKTEDNGCVVSAGLATDLSRIIIPYFIDGSIVVAIDKEAFWTCYDLKTVFIPSSVRFIGDRAFYGCRRLKDIRLPASLETIGNEAFAACSAIKELEIPNGVTRIEDQCFMGCTSLESIKLPDNLIHIGEKAFYNCDSLTEIYIPEGVGYIGKYAFAECEKLEKITFGGSSDEWKEMMDIHDYSFNDNYYRDIEIIFEK